MPTESADRLSPPYIPFGTLVNFIERLKTTAIPSTIDNSVMPNLAGGVRGQVRSALRFLGLTDPDDHVTPTFRKLIAAHGTDSWVETLGEVVDTAYQPILNGLDLRATTPSQLLGKFKAVGMTGQMAEKAIRFLLAAMGNANRPVSPHLANRGALTQSGNGRRSPKSRVGSTREREEQDEPQEREVPPSPNAKTRSFTFPVPGESDIRLVIPERLSDQDVWEMVDMTVRSYIRLNAKARGSSGGASEGNP
jgi:hypothetical protein